VLFRLFLFGNQTNVPRPAVVTARLPFCAATFANALPSESQKLDNPHGTPCFRRCFLRFHLLRSADRYRRSRRVDSVLSPFPDSYPPWTVLWGLLFLVLGRLLQFFFLLRLFWSQGRCFLTNFAAGLPFSVLCYGGLVFPPLDLRMKLFGSLMSSSPAAVPSMHCFPRLGTLCSLLLCRSLGPRREIHIRPFFCGCLCCDLPPSLFFGPPPPQGSKPLD